MARAPVSAAPSGGISVELRQRLLFVLLAIIVYPLLRSGRPELGAGGFALCLGYFAGIGAGFMVIQIALLEVFSLFLGHPTYAYPVILFSMILFAGLGSLLSERIPREGGAWAWAVPLLAGLLTLVTAAAIPAGTAAPSDGNDAARRNAPTAWRTRRRDPTLPTNATKFPVLG